MEKNYSSARMEKKPRGIPRSSSPPSSSCHSYSQSDSASVAAAATVAPHPPSPPSEEHQDVRADDPIIYRQYQISDVLGKIKTIGQGIRDKISHEQEHQHNYEHTRHRNHHSPSSSNCSHSNDSDLESAASNLDSNYDRDRDNELTQRQESVIHRQYEVGGFSSFVKHRRTKKLDHEHSQYSDLQTDEFGIPIEDVVQKWWWDRSLLIFSPQNKVRVTSRIITNNRWFDRFIFLVILANCVTLALWDPTGASNQDYLVISDYVFTGIFTVEMIIRVIARGFILNPVSEKVRKIYGTAYLRNPWYWLDFIVVVTAYPSFFVDGPSLNVFRIFKVLRPLRTATVVPAVRRIVSGLILAIPSLIDVLVQAFFVITLFSLLGLMVFMGVLTYRCVSDQIPDLVLLDEVCGYLKCPTDFTCMPNFQNPFYGFLSYDNILWAFLTNFQCISLENWVVTAYLIMDATSTWSYLFFLAVIVLGAFIVAKLITAVIAESFLETSGTVKPSMLDEEVINNNGEDSFPTSNTELEIQIIKKQQEKQKLKDLQMRISTSYKRFTTYFVCLNDVRKPVAKFVQSRFFNFFITFAVIANTAIMAAEYYGMPQEIRDAFYWCNVAFTAFFTIEMLIKMFGLGIVGYFSAPSNCFDFIIVILSLIEYCIPDDVSGLNIFRSFRLLRLFKLLATVPALYHELPKIIKSTWVILDFMPVLLLSLFAWTIFGMQLFGGKYKDVNDRPCPYQADPELECPRGNFNSFWDAFLLVFQVMTGEGWNQLMFDAMHFTSPAAALYFVCMFTHLVYVVLNVFLSVILVGYDEQDEKLAEEEWHTQEAARLNKESITADVKFIKQVIVNIFMWKHPLTNTQDYFEGKKKRKQEREELQEQQRHMRGRDDNDEDDNSDKNKEDDKNGPGDNPKNKENDEDHDNTTEVKDIEIEKLTLEDKILVNESEPVGSLPGQQITEDFDLDHSSRNQKQKLDPQLIETGRSEGRNRKTVRILIPDQEQNKLVTQNGSNPTKDHNGFNPVDDHQNQNDSNSSPANDDSDRMLTTTSPVGSDVPESPISLSQSLKRDKYTELSGKSLFMLSTTNPFRRRCYDVISHKYFDWFILFIILVSSVMLALYYPTMNPDGKLANTLEISNYVFVAIFTLEAVLKIIALGFIFHKQSYIRNPWNVLDFVIVVTGLVDVALAGTDLSILRVFRVFRALRPLRLITRLQTLRILVSSLIQAMIPCVGVFLFTFLIWTVFAILGVQLWSGTFYTCECPIEDVPPTNQTTTQELQVLLKILGSRDSQNSTRCDVSKLPLHQDVRQECIDMGGQWVTFPANFDNTAIALLTLFEVASLSNWQDIMYAAMDATQQNELPIPYNSPAAGLYFIVFIIVGSFFVQNLVVTILVDTFSAIKKQNESGITGTITAEQREWIEGRKLIQALNTSKVLHPPKGTSYFAIFRKKCFSVAISFAFEITIIFIICLNAIIMSLQWYNQNEKWESFEFAINWAFLLIYIIEAVIKILGLGQQYFQDGWNIFDFVIVILGIVGMGFETEIYVTGFSSIPFSPSSFQAIRSIRVFRLLRLVHRFKTLRLLFDTFTYSLPSVANIGSLIFLLCYIYAIIGVSLFGDLPVPPVNPPENGGAIGRYNNFSNFGWAMILLIQIITGDNWNGVMWDIMNLGGIYRLAPIYFVSFVVMGTFTMLNLFIAVVLDMFTLLMQREKFKVTEQDFDNFRKAWAHSDPDGDQYINIAQHLRLFLMKLGPPLGLEADTPADEIVEFVGSLNLPNNTGTKHEGCVQFNVLLQALVRRLYERQGVDVSPFDTPDTEDSMDIQAFTSRLNSTRSLKDEDGSLFNNLKEEDRIRAIMAAATLQIAAKKLLVKKTAETENSLQTENCEQD